MPLAMPPGRFKQRMWQQDGSELPHGSLGHQRDTQVTGKVKTFLGGRGTLLCLRLLSQIQISSSWMILFSFARRIIHCLDLPLKASSTLTGIKCCRREFSGPSFSWASLHGNRAPSRSSREVATKARATAQGRSAICDVDSCPWRVA